MTKYFLKKNGNVVLTEIGGDTSFLTIDEIVEDVINNRLTDADKEAITSPEYVPFLHFDFGMSIRNSYGLWLEECPLTEPSNSNFIIDGIDCNPKHPDAISADIVAAILDKLMNKPSKYDHAMQVVE